MMWKTHQYLATLGFSLCVAHCSESPSEGDPSADAAQRGVEVIETELPEASFADLDADGNAFLDREETRRLPQLREIFSLADTDQDGLLSVAEFSHATIEGTKVSADAARGPLFLELDSDRNGQITEAEAEAVPQLSSNFEHFDRDRNGGIDADEYMAARDVGLTPE